MIRVKKINHYWFIVTDNFDSNDRFSNAGHDLRIRRTISFFWWTFRRATGRNGIIIRFRVYNPLFRFSLHSGHNFSVDIRAIQKISRSGLDSACIVYFIHNIFYKSNAYWNLSVCIVTICRDISNPIQTQTERFS